MTLLHGDCLEQLHGLADESMDSLVTDPPAGISFMGKDWDSDKGGRTEWIAWMASVMRECHRVLKPGAHGLIWAIPRTSHWTATALEDAGFEIRDVVTHLFGQGFPKSLDISKAIDKAAGLQRERIPGGQGGSNAVLGARKPGEAISDEAISDEAISDEAISDEAKTWQGWGTALKPAAEFWILVRKPISEKTVAANVLKYGTGGLNIDGSRIDTPVLPSERRTSSRGESKFFGIGAKQDGERHNSQGRFPANLVFSHEPDCTDDQCTLDCAIRQLDAQSGTLAGAGNKVGTPRKSATGYNGTGGPFTVNFKYDAGGGASRFFYCAKISPGERNAGLEDMPDREGGIKNASGRGFSESDPNRPVITKNHHPTVKPKKLMGYLIKLITPPGGTVLDPFMGSGSTGVAARELGFGFVGIEREVEYFEIASKRMEAS
jgi:hypothetical protein